jgi:hypothetical protein
MLQLAMNKLDGNLKENCDVSVRAVAESRVLSRFELKDKRNTSLQGGLSYRVPELRNKWLMISR